MVSIQAAALHSREMLHVFFIYFIIFINVPNSTGAKTSVRAASLMGSFLSVNALWIRAAHDLEATYFPIKRPRVVRFLIF